MRPLTDKEQATFLRRLADAVERGESYLPLRAMAYDIYRDGVHDRATCLTLDVGAIRVRDRSADDLYNFAMGYRTPRREPAAETLERWAALYASQEGRFTWHLWCKVCGYCDTGHAWWCRSTERPVRK